MKKKPDRNIGDNDRLFNSCVNLSQLLWGLQQLHNTIPQRKKK